MMLVLLLALLWQTLPILFVPARPVEAVQADPSPAVSDSARAAVAAFNRVWRNAWEESNYRQAPVVFGDHQGVRIPVRQGNGGTAFISPFLADRRRDFLHCHPDGTESYARLDANIIESDAGRRAVCPGWDVDGEAPPYDERRWIDAGIAPELLPALRGARDTLMALLDRAARAEPSDDWIAGQRVRFALDQGDTNRALAAASACEAQPGWCMALTAYVRYGRGEIARADSGFERALPLLRATERCAWSDLSDLLDPAAVGAYHDMPCIRRDSINERIWWLARPLYTEPGNERRAEHFARMVDTKLRSNDRPAQRWAWGDRDGGKAVREMMTRYGWPAYSYWMGHNEDVNHYAYLNIYDSTVIDRGIFATAEYPLNRYHLIPAWPAIADPWTAPASDWTIAIPRIPKTDVPDLTWWPREHAEHTAGPLVPLPDHQTGIFRREHEVTLAVATPLQPLLAVLSAGGAADGFLIVSPAPDSISITPEGRATGPTVVMQALIPSRPAIVGVEYRSAGGTSARTRFGITPPPPLSALRPGEIAISAPVFVRAGATGAIPESNAEQALPLMYGSTTFSVPGRVGVYWETYGVNEGDTVDVSLRISQRAAAPGLLRRLGARLGLLSTAPDGIAVAWREPAPGRIVTTVQGPHSIRSRNVTIDLSQLAPGNYTVDVSVARRAGLPVSASRDLTILPR